MMPIFGWESLTAFFIALLFLLLFVAGVTVLIVLVVRAAFRPSQRKDERSGPLLTETPLEILKKRYAQGEITREEYLEMRRDLDG